MLHLQDPAPGAAGRLIDLGGLVLRFHDVPGDGGLDNGLQVAGDGNGAPGRAARNGQAHGARAVAADFLRHREGEAVGAIGVADEPPAAVCPVHAGFAEERPAVVPVAEQCREHVAVAVAVLAQGLIGLIIRLIAGRSTGEAGHRPHHRAQKARRPVPKHVPRRFLRNHTHFRVGLGRIDPVAERNVVRAHLEDNIHQLLSILDEGEHGPVGLIVHGRLLDGRDAVVVGNRPFQEPAGQTDPLGEIADIGLQTQRRAPQERNSIIGHTVRGHGALVRNRHHQPSVRAGHALLRRGHRQREEHQSENQGYLFHHDQRYKLFL